MSLDFLSCIQGFVAVAEYKGFSQASRHLHISTPMLTNQIKRLEESLGKKLLHRTTRYVALTEAGEIYLIRARKILTEIQDAQKRNLPLGNKASRRIETGHPQFI